jgi:hypothetical protein
MNHMLPAVCLPESAGLAARTELCTVRAAITPRDEGR